MWMVALCCLPISSQLCSSVFSGDESTFNQLVKLHDATDSNEEQMRIYRSLGAGKTKETLRKKCLEFAITAAGLGICPAVHSVGAQKACWYTRALPWGMRPPHVHKHNPCGEVRVAKGPLPKQLPAWQSCGGRCLYCSLTYVWVATAGFVTEEKAMEIETSFKNNPALSAEEIVKQNCEAICLNGKWLERDSKANEEWLKTHANSIDDHR